MVRPRHATHALGLLTQLLPPALPPLLLLRPLVPVLVLAARLLLCWRRITDQRPKPSR